MEIRVFVLPGGKLQIMVDGAGLSFEQAKAATAQVLAQLQAQGIPAEMIGNVEQHKDGVDHVHIQHEVKNVH